MNRAVNNNTALWRAAKQLCLPAAPLAKQKTRVQEHTAPPRSSLGPALKKPFSGKRQFSTVAAHNASNTIVNFVPQNRAIVVERLGKFHDVLKPGLNLRWPWPIESFAYEYTLKEQVLSITPLQSITKDNMAVSISGMLYMQITDPKKTAYGVENPVDAMGRLAQSTMRTALGNLTLDEALTSRDDLHQLIVGEMNRACEPWGIVVLRYNITSLEVPRSVQDSMEQLVKANRTARALITEAEGKATAAKLNATGQKTAIELNSEAERIKLTNEAEGRASAARVEAEGQAAAIRCVAEATAHALDVVAAAMTKPGAHDAAMVQLTKHYTEAFAGLAKTTNATIFLQSGQTPAEIVASIAQAAGRLLQPSKV